MGMCILYSPGAMDLLTLLACFPTGGVCVCVCVRVYMCICTNIDICMCTHIQSLFCHHPTGLYASQIRPLYPDFDAHKAILCPTYNPQTHTQDVSSFLVKEDSTNEVCTILERTSRSGVYMCVCIRV
jgi:hypothetical protein